MADSTATLRRDNTASKYPARYTDSVLEAAAEVLGRHLPVDGAAGLVPRVLDPFAGTGRIHELREFGYETVGVEIEPEWAALSAGAYRGDATDLPDSWAGTFHAVVTSPVHGNYTPDLQAMAGAHGRVLHRNNAGRMHAWQPEYWELHRRAWQEATRVLHRYGLLVLNTSDFIRNGEGVSVTDGHISILEGLEFKVLQRLEVATPRLRRGSNGDALVVHEDLTVLCRNPRQVPPCRVCGASFACIGPNGVGRGCECGA